MLGLIYLHTADYERALISFRDSLKIRQSVLDMDHADVLVRLFQHEISPPVCGYHPLTPQLSDDINSDLSHDGGDHNDCNQRF
jgi:hypothetical protein